MPSGREITWHPPFYRVFIFFLHFIPLSCININKENIPPRQKGLSKWDILSFYVHLMRRKRRHSVAWGRTYLE